MANDLGTVSIRLLAELDRFAANRGHPEMWVATGGPAVGFCRQCGWRQVGRRQVASGDSTTVLTKPLPTVSSLKTR